MKNSFNEGLGNIVVTSSYFNLEELKVFFKGSRIASNWPMAGLTRVETVKLNR